MQSVSPDVLRNGPRSPAPSLALRAVPAQEGFARGSAGPAHVSTEQTWGDDAHGNEYGPTSPSQPGRDQPPARPGAGGVIHSERPPRKPGHATKAEVFHRVLNARGLDYADIFQGFEDLRGEAARAFTGRRGIFGGYDRLDLASFDEWTHGEVLLTAIVLSTSRSTQHLAFGAFYLWSGLHPSHRPVARSLLLSARGTTVGLASLADPAHASGAARSTLRGETAAGAPA